MCRRRHDLGHARTFISMTAPSASIRRSPAECGSQSKPRRVLRQLSPGWNSVDYFTAAWKAALGFWLVGHFVLRKSYASSIRFLRHEHEMAYL